jgi:sterol 3beta-glucosyltransferase
MTRCVVEAVVQADVRAILSKGWSDRGSKDKGEADDKDEGEDDDKDGADGADGVEYPKEI